MVCGHTAQRFLFTPPADSDVLLRMVIVMGMIMMMMTGNGNDNGKIRTATVNTAVVANCNT